MILPVLVSSFAVAQNNVDDSDNQTIITPDTTFDKKEKKWKFLLSLDGRKSFVLGENTSIGGLKIGASYKNKYKMGFGIYNMRGNIERNGHPGQDITNSEGTLFYKFGYQSVYFERVWKLNRRWQASIPVHFGGAVIESRYSTLTADRPLFSTLKAPVFEFSGVAQYKLLRWLAIGTGAGYRSVLAKDSRIKQALSAPVYILQLKILFGVIWNSLLDKSIYDGWNDSASTLQENN